MNKDTLTELEANGYLVLDEDQTEYLICLLKNSREVLEFAKFPATANCITEFLKEVGHE